MTSIDKQDSDYHTPVFFSHVPLDSWTDWRWQLKNSVKSLSSLAGILGWPNEYAHKIKTVADKYPVMATPFYLGLAKDSNPQDPVIMQCAPQLQELKDADASPDPLGENASSPVSRLVHRYEDRALFLTCGTCAVHCRHCMRKRVWDTPLAPPNENELSMAVDYLKAHHEVRELLISGGDPLVMSDSNVAKVIDAFASVPSLEVLRIGTRTLVALPQRFTTDLCRIFENSGKTIWLASHFNHPYELSNEAASAVKNLMKHGVSVVNQSVLLKGINDSPDTLAKLFTGLLKINIKPYYLFHGDPVLGTTCFRTGLKAGLDIMAQLRSKISGLAIPAFAFDLPDGGGKIRLEPDFTAGQNRDGDPLFLNLKGTTTAYK